MNEDDDYVCPDPIRSYDVKYRNTLKWIPINAEILCNNTDMLLCVKSGNIYIGWLDDHDNTFYDVYDNPIHDVTHYVYLSEISRPDVFSCITSDEWVTKVFKKKKKKLA